MILSDHAYLATRVNKVIKPIPLFQSYLKRGYYPYYKEEKQFYHAKLLNTLNTILETDLPAVEKIESYSIQKIKKLLLIIAGKVPFTPNITELSNQIGVSRNSLLNYLTFLEKAQLINLLNQGVSGLSLLAKPEKIYLNNTNLVYALEENKPDIGNIRETFFFNQLKAVATVTSSKKTDFTVNNQYSFEIGGKNKGHEQVIGLKGAYLALDNVEYGFGSKIPLWLFGFLY
jgi:predicted AAA+ superfamily ATPase